MCNTSIYQEYSGFREAISSLNLSTLSFYLAKSCEAEGVVGGHFIFHSLISRDDAL